MLCSFVVCHDVSVGWDPLSAMTSLWAGTLHHLHLAHLRCDVGLGIY